MSDLIDFDSPNPKTAGQELASPLIPAPKEPPKEEGNARDLASGAGSAFALGHRRSYENNPFDVLMKKVTEYERNKEDPFERFAESKEGRNDLVQEENDMSIITDLNNTNLIGDRVGRFKWSCDDDGGDNSKLPEINVSLVSNKADLSILNNSAMNDDSFLGSAAKTIESTQVNGVTRGRSASQNDYLSNDKPSPQKIGKRSMSVTDSLKNSVFGETSSLSSAYRSSTCDDPLNDAFRKSQLLGDDSSAFSSQLYLSTSRSKIERLNSNSSIFSGLSNISAIPEDSCSKARQDRFCSENSLIGLSNLSIIPSNTTSNSDLSVFSNNTMNKAFMNSRSQLNSASFNSTVEKNTSQKSNNKSDDLVKKFYEIKRRMSSQVDLSNNENNEKSPKERDNSSTKSDEKCDGTQNSVEQLVDINTSSNSVFSDPLNVDDIIVNEAKALAQTFEKLATSEHLPLTAENDLLFSKTELNFDDLPPSDDEAVDNLIDLPTSPPKSVDTEKIEKTNNEDKASVNKNLKALESEFIDQADSNKKAVATTLLLDLQKIINKDSNPEACKVLNDLQNILGVKCDNNTELLKNCLYSVNGFSCDKKNTELESCEEKSDIQNVSPTSMCDEMNVNRNVNSNPESNVETEKENVDIKDTLNLEKSPKIDTEDQKIARNLLGTLNKIVNKKDENNVVDFLSSLGSILNMATELRTKTKEITKLTNENETTPKSISKKNQNKSFQTKPQRRSGLLNKSLNASINSDASSVTDKRKSYLLNSRRFPSDQSLLDKKKMTSVVLDNKKPHLPTSNVVTESIKSKFKKNTSTQVVNKKGPLKAIIPLGSMQKQASTNERMQQVHVTPPKSESTSMRIPTSTPNSSRSYKTSKSNPKASSTPNAEDVKKPAVMTERRSISRLPKNFKSSSADNLLTLNSSLRRSGSFRTKRLDQTLSPEKKLPQTPKRNAENVTESRLPRYSPRPMRIRNNSITDLRTSATKSPKLTPKVASEKLQRYSVSSPLRNFNKQRPTNLISRLGRSSIQTGPEKENYV